jgi:long-chain acyl-CoA synthetase
VFHPLQDKLGLIRVNSAYTAGAALSPDVVRFFRAIGVNIKQLYGSTEAQIHTLHVGEDVKFESVGVPPPDVDIRISDEGEILVKAPSVFQGYYKAPDKTAEKLKDGWFYTGDAGYIDEDGHLIYLDRMDDLLELKGGEKFSPQYIEGRLKFSPYIKDLMSIGGRERAYVTAIINIDFDNVGRWAEKRGIAYTTFVDLSQRPEVYDLIRADVERVNKSLPPAARLRKFVLMHKEFDPDEAELTRTRKLRRGFMEQRYRQMIDAMYNGLDEVRVRAEVKYRDGRHGVVETPVRVCSLGMEEVLA